MIKPKVKTNCDPKANKNCFSSASSLLTPDYRPAVAGNFLEPYVFVFICVKAAMPVAPMTREKMREAVEDDDPSTVKQIINIHGDVLLHDEDEV